MSGDSAGAGDGGGLSAAGLSGLLDKFKNSPAAAGVSQFSADGSAPSQFSMPGGGIPQYQGASMMPATLGGVQGVADAQDYSQMVQDQSGMTNANWQQMAQKMAGAAGGFKGAGAGDTANAARAMGGARASGGGAANYVPTQLPMGSPAMAAQGTINLANPAAGGATQPTANVQNLMQLLKLGNSGFNIR